MTFWKWSRIAANNGTADSTCPFPEGMSPAALNDGNRGMMAAAAKYRDDIAGAIVTGGTSTAYTVSSNQVFDTLAHLDGAMIAFTPHTTNTAGSPNITLNVDGLGAKTIQSSPGVDIPAGVLIQGTPYVVLYNQTNGIFYLRNFFGNPYNIPIGASVDFWGSTAPNSSFVLAYGQAISRTTYSALFALLGTTYGSGDGTTTFNVPDLRGRVIAGKDDMGGSAASRLTSTYFGASAASLGAVGGSESHTLTTAQLASHSHGVTDPGHNHATNPASPVVGTSSSVQSGTTTPVPTSLANLSIVGATTGITIQTAGSGNAHNNTQPTIIANKLLRII